MERMDGDELARTLKKCREPLEQSVTIKFMDSRAQHVVRPTKAFQGDWRGLAEHLADGHPYTVERS